MTNLLWSPVAWLLSRPWIADRLIAYAQTREPYHIEGYMQRWWIWNRNYENGWPSIRVHHILRADNARHMHNHPWNARTFILRGWYWQQWLGKPDEYMPAGKTGRVRHTDFHAIFQVPDEGVWTLFITYGRQHGWGFFIPWREYL